MRTVRALLAVLTTFAAVLAITLIPTTPASAERATFTDRRDDVPTGNDIRSIRANYDFDLNVTYRLKAIPNGQLALYLDTSGSPSWDYIWFGNLGGPEEFDFYTRSGWNNGTPIDCDYDYFKNRESSSVRLFISGDCFTNEYDALRFYSGTTYYDRKSDNYINVDWAPGPRGAYYPYVDNG